MWNTVTFSLDHILWKIYKTYYYIKNILSSLNFSIAFVLYKPSYVRYSLYFLFSNLPILLIKYTKTVVIVLLSRIFSQWNILH